MDGRAMRNSKERSMAEREGFEPPGPCGPAVFKTAAIDHSATSPEVVETARGKVALVELSCACQPPCMPAPDPSAALAEIQGLYGPFTFSEMLLQKIWAQRDFDPAQLRTTDGRRVRVLQPGRWNRLGGPDFKAARFQLGDGPMQVADVELHLRAEDWQAHGHARDPAFNGVALHVVLFPPAHGHQTRGEAGRAIPVLPLLPALRHDLEAYAAEEAVEALANRPAARVRELLERLPADTLELKLRAEARRRWEQKVRFAAARVGKLGWTEACHQTALEILGYRHNRVPMLRIAAAHPFAAWRDLADEAIERIRLDPQWSWTLSGVRPANHPRHRLHQYAAWVRQSPAWPERLRAQADRLPAISLEESTRQQRRAAGFPGCRSRFAALVCGGAVGGTRLDTLVCDGFLPLLAGDGARGLEGWWYHWFPGDLPRNFVVALRQAGVFARGTAPVCHGMVQGLIGWLLAQEEAA